MVLAKLVRPPYPATAANETQADFPGVIQPYPSPSGRRHGRSRPQNDVSSELIGVKQADALPNALGAFG
jgi:hypothetical protein